MKEIQYKTFSIKTHGKNWKAGMPNVCQFELTFACGLHCRHCYTDCYNKPHFIKRQLDAAKVKLILDKAHREGVIWVCFTGGDPLERPDFLEIYSYAKNKGFIISVFTNGYSMSRRIAGYLKKRPPFVLEMTLNAATKELYEKISQVRGSFEKVMEGINLILNSGLPLKIKTQVTKDNFNEAPEIKKFVRGLGLKFRPSIDLHARLNGDLSPCSLRVAPENILKQNSKKEESVGNCRASSKSRLPGGGSRLFHCAISGGDGFHVDPYGNTFPCNLIRRPAVNLLKYDIVPAMNKILPLFRRSHFSTGSNCGSCNLRQDCFWCPGRARLETGDMEAPVKYYCVLSRT